MVAIKLLEVKECMSELLLKDTFDSFSFIEADITTFMTFHVDGYLKKDFFTESEQTSLIEEGKLYPTWGEARQYIYNLIKGNKTPLNFKFVLNFSKENTEILISNKLNGFDISNVSGLFLRFHYDNGNLECITGTSTHTFTMDKSLELVWDDTAQKYLTQKGILFESL